MNEYRVIFEIDAEGKSPRDAAEYVYAKYFGRDPEAVDPDDACCFTVIDDEAGEGWSVDLAEDGAERLPASKAEPVNAQLHHALRIIMEDEHRLLPAERELGSAALAAAEQGAPATPEPVNASLLAALKKSVGLIQSDFCSHRDPCSKDNSACHAREQLAAIAEAEQVQGVLRTAHMPHLIKGPVQIDPAKLPADLSDMIGKVLTHGRVVSFVPPQIIRLEIWRGVVNKAVGLPPGVTLEVHDMDPNYDEKPPCEQHPDENCCVHEFKG